MVGEDQAIRKVSPRMNVLVVIAIIATVTIGAALWTKSPRAKVDRCQSKYMKVIHRCRAAAEPSGDIDNLVRCYNRAQEAKEVCGSARR